MNVKIVRHYSRVFTSIGWFVGLTYYEWFASTPTAVPLWEFAILAIVGGAVASTVICATMDTLAGAITYKITGDFEGSSDFFAWMTFISPVLAFFVAKYALRFLS
jgi:hypothetical protein